VWRCEGSSPISWRATHAPVGNAVAAVVATLAITGCGKKGPPLPPLISLPAAPGESTAIRRGMTVEIQFTVPGNNTDGSKPADVERVDVYGLTQADASPDEIVQRGSRIGSVPVNPPPDPDDDPDAVPTPDAKAPPKRGIDQGTVGRVVEDLAAVLAGGSRSYVTVGVNRKGRRGAMSPRTTIPLGPPPPPPGAPTITYTDTRISVSWTAVAGGASPPATYHIYEPGPTIHRLSARALVEPPYTDERIAWGEVRCYAVRTVQTTGGLTMESEASEPACVTLTDTFPPAAPTGLTAVAGDGSISLIWNASAEKDAAGYLVLRAIAPAATPVPVTPAPIPETTFRDTVAAGVRVIYAVQAVDTAGNVSPMSAPIEETAR
jgi:hypothetical protein